MIVRMLSAGSALLLLAAVVTLVVFAARTAELQRRASMRALLVVFFVGTAPALAMSALWWRDALRVVIELHGIAFRSESGATLRKDVRERAPGSNRVLIGDVPARSRRMPQTLFGTFVFKPGANASHKGSLSIELPPPALRAGAIATAAHGILGAQELADGDRICIRAECWTYSAGDDSFRWNGKSFAIPPRQTKLPGIDWSIPLPFARPITSALRTYSIDFLARQGSASSDTDSLRSFVAYSRPGPRLRVMLLDEQVTLWSAAAAAAAFKKAPAAAGALQRFEIADGTRIQFFTLPAAGEDFQADGLAERRSAVYRAGARSFALDFDTPEVHALREDELKVLYVDAKEKQKRVPLAMGDAQLVDRSLYFSGTSESVALQSSALIELPQGSNYRIVSPRGPADAQLGETTWIGTTDLAAIRMSVIRPPLLLLLAALLLQLLKVASAAESRFTNAQLLFAGALELLVGVRLLFGHRAWAMPPHRLEAAELGLVAWMALPWIFLMASAPAISTWRRIPRSWFLPLTGLLASAIFCARVVEGPKKFVWIACHLLAIAVPFVRLRKITMPSSRQLLLIAAAFLVIRVVLLLFGFKESLMFPGGRVSLSAMHIPAAVILEGAFLWHLWQRVTRNGRLQRNDLLQSALLLALVWLVPAALTSDIGLALLNVPVFLFFLLAIDRRNVAVRVAVVLTLLFVAGAPLARVVLPFIASEETLLTLASDSNYARFLHFAAPEQLQSLATKRGESLAITSAILQRYISTGLFGVGYGHTDVSPHLGDTALRDFAPAVFIAAEWGLAGTLAMLLLYSLFGYLAWRMTPWSAPRRAMPLVTSSPVPVFAAVAAATIAVASVYMILANHELVLLTGKNAYLFGLDSAGDVLESMALLLIVAFGTSYARDSNGALPGGFR
jgi:UPF0716 family protein affecting phage T7 exclusion